MIKRYKEFSPKQLVHKGECWVTEYKSSLHNLAWGDVEPKLKVSTNQGPTCLKDNVKRLGADALMRLPWATS